MSAMSKLDFAPSRHVSRARAGQVLASLSPRERAIVDTLQLLRLASGGQLRRLHFIDRGDAGDGGAAVPPHALPPHVASRHHSPRPSSRWCMRWL